MQSKLGSMIESVTNTGVGYVMGVTINMFLFPLFGWDVSVGQSMTVGAVYILISLVRSYILRRIFNCVSERRHD